MPPSSNGQVTGSVVNSAGAPVAQARVNISQALPASTARPSAPPVITGAQVASTVTNSQGQFAAFLPPGNYVACAASSTQGNLDPCHWATSAPTFTVSKSQVVSGVKVAMAAGAVLTIQINDPNQLLAPVSGPTSPDCRVQVVTGKGRRYEAAIANSTSTGRNHVITVPFGSTYTIQVISPSLAINDSSGKPATSAGASLTTPANGNPPVVSFAVSGAKP